MLHHSLLFLKQLLIVLVLCINIWASAPTCSLFLSWKVFEIRPVCVRNAHPVFTRARPLSKWGVHSQRSVYSVCLISLATCPVIMHAPRLHADCWQDRRCRSLSTIPWYPMIMGMPMLWTCVRMRPFALIKAIATAPASLPRGALRLCCSDPHRPW